MRLFFLFCVILPIFCIKYIMFSGKDRLNRSYYLIGIGGVSMSALALLLHKRGYSVRGSDRTASTLTDKLKKAGISVHIGEEEEICESTVVYTGAISHNHRQLIAARKAGKRILSRAKFLGEIAEGYPHVIAISGCHGKTSCSAMLAHIFFAAKKPFTCHIGGEDRVFGNYARFGDKYFITEACEYQKSFLSLHSECAVVLNVDRDHMDCYRDENDLLSSFQTFIQQSKYSIVCEEDENARTLAHTCSYGIAHGEYRAESLVRNEKGCYTFTVTENGRFLTMITLNTVGKTYVLNALAAIAVARYYQISADAIRKGLKNFVGVKRRFEEVGTILGVRTICDYAHHPHEIAAAFEAAQSITKGTVRVVFQPHTYSRTKDLMEQFVKVLNRAENPIIYATYAAREQFDGDGSAYALVGKVSEAVYVQSPQQIKSRLKGAIGKNDLVLVLGAGDIYEKIKEILD